MAAPSYIIAIVLSGFLFAGDAHAKPLRAALWPRTVPVPTVKNLGSEIEVVGGQPSQERRVVGITFIQDGQRRICSGMLLTPKIILTAAHCTCNSSDYRVSNAPFVEDDWRPAHFKARFQSYNCNSGPVGGNDIALLTVDRALFGDDRALCPFSTVEEIRYVGSWRRTPDLIQVAGYGFEGDKPTSWGTRRSVEVVVNSFICIEPAAQFLGCARSAEMMMGVGRLGAAKDTCAGDSGGPAFVKVGEAFVPIGLVSRGVALRQPFPKIGMCGAGGLYTHLGRQDVFDWLKANGVPSTSRC